MTRKPQMQGNLNPAPPQGPTLSLAQHSNMLELTARAYALWRARSLGVLSGGPFSLEREARLFRALCQPQADETWLDAGTSAGFYAGVLAEAGCRVLAADLSPPMLREGQRREQSPRIDWALLNLEDSGLPSGGFNGVTVGATLNETQDPARFLHELARVLRPGGQLWLMYVPRTGGPLQGLLSKPALGGLNFPDPAWVGRHLPGMTLTDGLEVGAVRFGRYVKDSGPSSAAPPRPESTSEV
ncbi:2-polyprenyl-6-hydroxyphenyl methylase/3-demethylubiquinone-9 3-methyltransferase [Deinococcus humi]|uniref:2-polyprenyl-6-hydroxyphenyl methylase/3-demethylubiquinone-9 3-methyltransferase n=1 Tax=Deinococcus humi TaxID=662880 RepID=A0A7W8JYT6_9DEIO|nr:2-polyprenyl-6-hydroxyphenyl methylase/3-demethylubiquinone-9 3-methyltransferase [Deinococcus humi]